MNRRNRLHHGPGRLNAVIFGLLAGLLAGATPAVALQVGYYDMDNGQGVNTQQTAIVTAGQVPVPLNTLSAAELATVDIILIQNPTRGST